MKIFSIAAISMAAAMSATSAKAEALLDFCVDAKPYFAGATAAQSVASCNGSGAQAGSTGFVADKISGNYQEKVLGTGFDSGGNLTFKSVTVFDFTAFARNEGGNSYIAAESGLGAGYRLYAVIEALGTVTGGGSSFAAGSATLKVYLNHFSGGDPFTNVGINSIVETPVGMGPLIGDISFQGDVGNNDILIGTASNLVSGSGTTSTSGGTDGFAVSFDDFGLTTAGEGFFIAPRPFHMYLYADGSILDGTLTGAGQVVSLNGSGDARFTVPEPGTLAMVGLALLGLGAASRRKRG